MPYRAALQRPWMPKTVEPSPSTATTGRSGRPMRRPTEAGNPQPRPPIAGLTMPSGCRAGMRSISSSRFDGHSSITTASAGNRSPSACRTWPAASGAAAAGGSGRWKSGLLRPGPLREASHERGADEVGRGKDRELSGAAVHLVGVVADHGEHGSLACERPRLVRALPEHRGADGDHDVVGLERVAQLRAEKRQRPGPLRVILRKPGLAAERLLVDRRAEPLGQRDERGPALRRVETSARNEGRPRGTL